jgi:D-alanine-D-alanine ligase
MVAKLNVGVIFGGRSGEHEVSLMSARSVLSVIDREKYQVYPIAITREGEWRWGLDALDQMSANHPENLTQAAIFPDVARHGLFQITQSGGHSIVEKVADLDVVFPVLHGTFGEDGTLQGLLEMTDIAYVGAGVLGSSVGMDKGLFKDVMRANQIPVVESILVTRGQIRTSLDTVIQQAEAMSPYPIFVKPANLGSSVGVSKCRSRSDLAEGLLEAATFDRRVLVERGVDAREIEVSVLGNDDPKASVAGEIRPGADFYSYEAKYILDNSELIIPARLTDSQMQGIREAAVRAYLAADCAGMARVDFLLDKNTSDYFLNEINTIPGFTKISMYPKLWEATGIPYPQLIDRLIELALERKADRDATSRHYRRDA